MPTPPPGGFVMSGDRGPHPRLGLHHVRGQMPTPPKGFVMIREYMSVLELLEWRFIP